MVIKFKFKDFNPSGDNFELRSFMDFLNKTAGLDYEPNVEYTFDVYINSITSHIDSNYDMHIYTRSFELVSDMSNVLDIFEDIYYYIGVNLSLFEEMEEQNFILDKDYGDVYYDDVLVIIHKI